MRPTATESPRERAWSSSRRESAKSESKELASKSESAALSAGPGLWSVRTTRWDVAEDTATKAASTISRVCRTSKADLHDHPSGSTGRSPSKNTRRLFFARVGAAGDHLDGGDQLAGMAGGVLGRVEENSQDRRRQE